MGPQPWALSPLVSTMPHLIHTPLRSGASPPAFPSRTESIGDDVSALVPISPSSSSSSVGGGRPDADSDRSSVSSGGSSASLSSQSSGTLSRGLGLSTSKKRRTPPSSSSSSLAFGGDPRKRRSHFSSPSTRQKVTFGPGDVLTTDFCYGFLAFPALALTLPGGLSFDLTRYWDGQPVRFVCCLRPKQDEGESVQDARVFWCVAIESVDE